MSTTSELTINQATESASTLTSSELSEATTKRYVTNLVRTRHIPMSMDITGYYPNAELPMTASQVSDQLLRMLPPAEHEYGTLVRIGTVRYFIENIAAITPPALTTTVLQDVTGSETVGGPQITTGVIREVSNNTIPARTPPRLYPIRGIWVFALNPTRTAWVESVPLVEDDIAPTNVLSGLSNFIRP